jgi:hypothetical protein
MQTTISRLATGTATALDILKTIAERNNIQELTLFKHEVGVNWRQQHPDHHKVKHLDSTCFKHNDHLALEALHLNASDLRELTLTSLISASEAHQVYSVSSLVKAKGQQWHIPMMNFHPDTGGKALVMESMKAIRSLRPDLVPPGVVLESGRYYHYYGFDLIKTEDFPTFLSYFLMPAILVSPRYIGHALYEERCSLRVTKDTEHKTQIPKVVDVLR